MARPLPEKDIVFLQSTTEEVVLPPPGYTDLDFGNPNEEANQVIDITLLPGVPGQRGPVGPQGPKGDPGENATPVNIAYTHTQNTVSSTWNITHNLGFHPNVTTTDASGYSIDGSVNYTDSNSLTVTFSIATTGFAYLS